MKYYNWDLHTPYSTVSFRVTLSDLEWLSKIFNDTKRRAVSLRQLSFLFFLAKFLQNAADFMLCQHQLIISIFSPYLTHLRLMISLPVVRLAQTTPCMVKSRTFPPDIFTRKYSPDISPSRIIPPPFSHGVRHFLLPSPPSANLQ